MNFLSLRFKIWAVVRGSYWFVPSTMSIAAVIAAFVSQRLDNSSIAGRFPAWFLLFSGGANGARDLIGVVAGSIITVAGVTFSISIVILSLASQQYGPRLLRNFMRDRAIHFTFGMFISTFVFSLLILPSIHSADEEIQRTQFIPRIGLSISLIMAIGCVFVLIFFIHHIAQSIQASFIIRSTYQELREVLLKLYLPHSQSKSLAESERFFAGLKEEDSFLLKSSEIGYCQLVYLSNLCLIAEKHDLFIQVLASPGQFLALDDPIMRIWGKVKSELNDELREQIKTGIQRTMEQDPAFGFEMLSEMAIRALSPSMNDPFTALLCLNYLRDALRTIGTRDVPLEAHLDSSGNPRLLFKSLTFEEILRRTLPGLYHYASGTPMVFQAIESLLTSLKEDSRCSVGVHQFEAFHPIVSKPSSPP